jgi:hypothetical protein
MKFYQPLPMHIFLHLLLFEDREIMRISDPWKINREEIQTILTGYYQALGIYIVKPNEFARLLREDVLVQLKQNPILLQKKNIARPR